MQITTISSLLALTALLLLLAAKQIKTKKTTKIWQAKQTEIKSRPPNNPQPTNSLPQSKQSQPTNFQPTKIHKPTPSGTKQQRYLNQSTMLKILTLIEKAQFPQI